MNHLPIYILALIVLTLFVWGVFHHFKVYPLVLLNEFILKYLSEKPDGDSSVGGQLEWESEPRDICGRFTSEEPQMELKRLFESRRGKVSFK